MKKRLVLSCAAACLISFPVPVSALPLDPTLVSIIVENFNVESSEVTPTASLVDDLGADSLDIVELMMAVEESYSIGLTDGACEKIPTVADLQSVVNATVSPIAMCPRT
ncbi:MAG: acyl carrier protein [Deltaproteobacteria bacterium]|nr:acyl carrier protein [Deltaproteobacteria bacterium]